MLSPTYRLPRLPPPVELETPAVLRELAQAHRMLGELKGQAANMPNQSILIDTLALQEARASSEVENIVTTQDELFEAGATLNEALSPAVKEVTNYREALKRGFDMMAERGGLLTGNLMVEIFRRLKGTEESFRSVPGTALKNQATGAIVYVPPQRLEDIQRHMTALERFINEDLAVELDPIVKMAVIHHQFESIHPFPDGNGRVGRIINVLYLARSGLIDIPILYLSRFITSNKSEYYRLLQAVRDEGAWEAWTLFMVRAVWRTAGQTLELVKGMRALMTEYKSRLRGHPTLRYSQDLLNNVFRHPYTRIEFLQSELGVTRQTASRYLEELTKSNLVEKQQKGRNNYYINAPLVQLLLRVSEST